MATLSQSTAYKFFNNNGEISQLIISIIKNSTPVDENMISEQLLQMKRSKFHLLNKVLDAYEKKDIIPIFTNVDNTLRALPFFTIKGSDGRVRSYIVLNNYGKLMKLEKELGTIYASIEMKTLYVLMEGAYISFRYSQNPGLFKRNPTVLKFIAEAYVGLFDKIMNREFALTMDRELLSKVNYVIAHFFLSNIAELENQAMVASYARTATNSISLPIDYVELEDNVMNANINTLGDMVVFLQNLNPKLRTFTLKFLTKAWINNYNAEAIFAMDFFPYLLFVIEATLLGSYIIRQPLIFDILKNIKSVASFYPELSRILS